MQNLIFKGTATALVTPFDKAGNINFKKLEQLIEFQVQNGADALLVAGTTGECSTLTEDEKAEMVVFASETIKKRVPLIAGAGTNCTSDTARECRRLEVAGADALLLVTPYYNKCSETGLIEHYKACADATSLPFILYNVPGRTGVNIRPELYEKLLKVKNVQAVKEASGDVKQAARIESLYRGDLTLYSGCDELTSSLLAIGASGVISVLSNIYPQVVHDRCARFFSGDAEKSIELQNKYAGITYALFAEVNPIPVKTAMNLLGWDVGGFRLPLCDADPEVKNLLRRRLEALIAV